MVELIKNISEINAISGNEASIRKYIIEHCSNARVDTMGNISVFKKGKSSQKKLMIATHIDECGLIVTNITEKGFIKFECVGDVELRSLISKKVIVADNVKGIIGMKAIHLQKKEERETVKKAKDLFIDIGAKDKKDAQRYVKKGDYISFATEFSTIGKRVKGKALDRIGAAIMLKLLDVEPQYDTYFVFTVQKEVEMRGAVVCASKINPDFAIVIDTIESADMFGCNDMQIQAKLGNGTVIQYSDKKSIQNRELTQCIVKKAEENKVPIQKSAAIKSIGNSGEIITSYGGIKTATVAVPVRYTHTPIQIADLNDVESTYRLIMLLLQNL